MQKLCSPFAPSSYDLNCLCLRPALVWQICMVSNLTAGRKDVRMHFGASCTWLGCYIRPTKFWHLHLWCYQEDLWFFLSKTIFKWNKFVCPHLVFWLYFPSSLLSVFLFFFFNLFHLYCNLVNWNCIFLQNRNFSLLFLILLLFLFPLSYLIFTW